MFSLPPLGKEVSTRYLYIYIYLFLSNNNKNDLICIFFLLTVLHFPFLAVMIDHYHREI